MKKGNLDVSKFPISVLVVVFFCDFRYLHDGLHYLLHYLDAHKLVRAVEVDTAGEDVRTRQTLEAQLGSVGPPRIGSTRGGTPLSCIALSTMSMTCMLGSIFSFML